MASDRPSAGVELVYARDHNTVHLALTDASRIVLHTGGWRLPWRVDDDSDGFLWLGTGSQAEYDHARTLTFCQPCLDAYAHTGESARAGGSRFARAGDSAGAAAVFGWAATLHIDSAWGTKPLNWAMRCGVLMDLFGPDTDLPPFPSILADVRATRDESVRRVYREAPGARR